MRHTWYWDNINAKNTLYANKKEVAEVFKAVGVQFPITREAVSNSFGSSIKTDEDLVKLKMQNETLYQTAWHGSPYEFTSFDLGMIGMGEGHQAHGWGLYFAKDRHISETYKTWLEHMPKVHTKTDTYTLDEEGRWILEKSGTRFEDGSPVDQALMAFEGAEGDLAAAKEDV